MYYLWNFINATDKFSFQKIMFLIRHLLGLLGLPIDHYYVMHFFRHAKILFLGGLLGGTVKIQLNLLLTRYIIMIITNIIPRLKIWRSSSSIISSVFSMLLTIIDASVKTVKFKSSGLLLTDAFFGSI